MRRIVLTLLLTAGIVAGLGSAYRHRHFYGEGCGHHHHHRWDHDHHEGGERPAAPKSETK